MPRKSISQKSTVLWIISGVLVLFLLIIAGLAMGLRNQLREQMVSRDGEVFVAVASAELVDVRELNQGLFDPGSDEELFEVACL